MQLEHVAARRLAQRPRVVARGEDREPVGEEHGEAVSPALEGKEVHVRHGAVALDVVDRLGEDGALHRQRPHALGGEERDRAGEELDLAERAGEARAPLRGERRAQRLRPGRFAALDRREEERRHALLGGGRDERVEADVGGRRGRQPAVPHEAAEDGPRL